MSTTTNFMRIALVAVAALGMGVLSSVPSQAAFSGTAGSQLTITVANGTGSLTGSASDSTTAGTVTVNGLALLSTDSYTVTAAIKSVPATTTLAVAPELLFTLVDTTSSTSNVTVTGNNAGAIHNTAMNTSSDSRTTVSAKAGADNSYVVSKFYAFQESTTAKTRVAGTYTYTLIVTPRTAAGGAGTAQTADITITIAAAASDSLVASAATSTAYISTATGATSDVPVSALATASDTPRGYIRVTLLNAASGTAARESVTITTTVGSVGTAENRGRSVVLKYTGAVDYNIY